MTDIECRRAWSRALIRKAPDAPPFGSPEWLTLPEGPEKVAAVVRAAENWARDGDELEERLRLEVDLMAHAVKDLEDAEYVARRDEWRREYGSKSYRPHPANRRHRGHLSAVPDDGAA